MKTSGRWSKETGDGRAETAGRKRQQYLQQQDEEYYDYIITKDKNISLSLLRFNVPLDT